MAPTREAVVAVGRASDQREYFGGTPLPHALIKRGQHYWPTFATMTIKDPQIPRELPEPTTAQTVAEFYKGRDVFITGATGFMGKVLLEKLLWSCEDVATVYLLMRPRKGTPPVQRVNEMVKLPVFDRLRAKDPSCFSKIVPICGDVTELGLGISAEDRRLLEDRVSVVIHAASSVRFDDPLKKAVMINVRGTRDVMELASKMRHLKTLTYVSTSYCNCTTPTIEEAVIKSDYNWKSIIKLAETTDDHTLGIVEAKILDKRPNTYTFTKSLAENVVYDYSDSLPCMIIRPSIVVHTYKEPVEGWVDNLNGPMGMIYGALTGVIHVLYGDKDIIQDYMPCDLAINGIIVATWYKGISDTKGCDVMNGATGTKKAIDMGGMLKYKDRILFHAPPSKMLWYPAIMLTTNRAVFNTLFFLTHIIPGLLVDIILKLNKVNFSLLRVYRKIFSANCALAYFMMNEWKIKTNNYDSMTKFMTAKDQDTFNYDPDTLNIVKGMLIGVNGMKQYIFKDDMTESAFKSARIQVGIRYWVHYLSKYLMYTLMLWYSSKFVLGQVINVIVSSLQM